MPSRMYANADGSCMENTHHFAGGGPAQRQRENGNMYPQIDMGTDGRGNGNVNKALGKKAEEARDGSECRVMY